LDPGAAHFPKSEQPKHLFKHLSPVPTMRTCTCTLRIRLEIVFKCRHKLAKFTFVKMQLTLIFALCLFCCSVVSASLSTLIAKSDEVFTNITKEVTKIKNRGLCVPRLWTHPNSQQKNIRFSHICYEK
jgi:hypothetical protein